MSEKVNTLVGRIIASTKRQKRTLSIVDIAKNINELKEEVGGIKKVSELIGISPGMLNQFLSVFSLPTAIQELVKEKKIDSVAMVFLLSKYPKEDVSHLAKMITAKLITSPELKVLLPYRNANKGLNISDVIDKLRSTKDIPVSVIRLPGNIINNPERIEKAIKFKIGDENLMAFEKGNEYLDIKITKHGEKILRHAAKEKGVTLQQFILRLLNYV